MNLPVMEETTNKIRTFYWSVESDSIKENLCFSELFSYIFNFLSHILTSIYSVFIHFQQIPFQCINVKYN